MPWLRSEGTKTVSGAAEPRTWPSAIWLILAAASRYRSVKAGDNDRASALLSNPYAALSPGSSAAESISSASRSRIALRYSMRLRRCSVGRPGLGCSAAARSRPASSDAATLSATGLSGRGRPAGGIAPVRSLRTTFSQASACSLTCAGSSTSSARPAGLHTLVVAADAVLCRTPREAA